jgi:hypothetical protein
MSTKLKRKRDRLFAGAGAILLISAAGSSLGIAGESITDLRRDALTQQAFEKVLPVLQALKPNDSLLSLEPFQKVYRDVSDTGRAPIVLMPGWISALSGGRIGGLYLLGEVTGRSGARLFGTHVFG